MILDFAPAEFLVLGAVALLVIPPKDLPRAMRFAGQWIGRARGMARQFRSGFDDMIRESEFQEMEKKWKAENERIMREFPPTPDQAMLMAPDAPAPESEDALAMTVEMPAVAPEPEPAPARKPRTTAAKKPAAKKAPTKTAAAKKPAPKRAKP